MRSIGAAEHDAALGCLARCRLGMLSAVLARSAPFAPVGLGACESVCVRVSEAICDLAPEAPVEAFAANSNMAAASANSQMPQRGLCLSELTQGTSGIGTWTLRVVQVRVNDYEYIWQGQERKGKKLSVSSFPLTATPIA